MCMAKSCGATRLLIYGDSNLVGQQTMRDCEASAGNMSEYQKLYNTLEGDFDGCKLNYITRENNKDADKLVNLRSTRGLIPSGFFLESIRHRSIKATKVLDPKWTKDPASTSTTVDKATLP